MDAEITPTKTDPSEHIVPMERQEFLVERRKFVEARQRVQQRTDQLVTGGAAGALLLSITFLGDIAPDPLLGSRPFLIVAWVLLLVSLLLNLGASFASQKAFEESIEHLDAYYAGHVPLKLSNRAAIITHWLSGLAAAAFVFGVASLAAFGFINIPFH